jgi:DNA-directed RNA polymerase specialized sigma24 family protein
VVAVRMNELGQALAGIDEEGRELLDLSMQRGMSDDEVADVLGLEADQVEQRRAKLLDDLASQLGLVGREERDELFATLQDIPEELLRSGS